MQTKTELLAHHCSLNRSLQWMKPHLDSLMSTLADKKRNLRILEVGCGSTPNLCYALAAAGHSVTGVDPSIADAALEKAKEVNAADGGKLMFIKKDFNECTAEDLNVVDDGFDAVLFTKSLHHILDMSQALNLVMAVLAPGRGRVLLEEFAREKMDNATATWLYGTLDTLVAAGFNPPPARHGGHAHHHHAKSSEGSTGTPENQHHHHGHKHQSERLSHFSAEAQQLPAVERYRRHHVHEPALHSGNAVISAVKSLEGVRSIEINHGAWLYLYFIDMMEPTPVGYNVVERVLKTEEQLIAAAAIQAIGLFIVVSKN